MNEHVKKERHTDSRSLSQDVLEARDGDYLGWIAECWKIYSCQRYCGVLSYHFRSVSEA